MKKVFYEKVGRKYVPIKFHDSEFMSSYPVGSHVVVVTPNGKMTYFDIDPAYAPMIAAGRIARDTISKAIMKASDLRLKTSAITEEQHDAWKALEKAFGEDKHLLEWPSFQEAAEAGTKAMIEEAERLLSNPAVKKAYEHFLLVSELTKDE